MNRLLLPYCVRQQRRPSRAITYVRRIEELVGCKVQIISTGPRREETILIGPVTF